MSNFYFKPKKVIHPKDSETNKIKKVKIKEDSEHRREIHETIIALIKQGLEKEEVLIRINSEFSDSIYTDFFTSWVEHAYNQKSKKQVNRAREIKDRIKELIKLGFPQEEILVRINSEYSNSKLKDFFKKWIEKAYNDQSKKDESLNIFTNYKDEEREI